MPSDPDDEPDASPGTARRLVAVLHLDVVGYTRLIELDDARTFERLRLIRTQIIAAEASRHGGRLHQSAGDSLLITFDSISGAVECAVVIQRAIATLQSDEAADRRLLFRAGVDISDVIPDGTDIHGNGVNIAVRLQAVCPVGEICISRAVHDHVQGRITLPAEPIGRLNLKNIATPVEAFVLRVNAREPAAAVPGAAENRTGAEAVPLAAPMPAPMPAPMAALPAAPQPVRAQEPSIATLPFRVLSKRSADRLLVDGIVEEINHTLAGLKELFVISRGSTLRYDADRADPATVARELGVGYILQGSVRRSARNLKIHTELVDANELSVIRSDQYDATDASLFELQERIALQIGSTIVPQVREREMRRGMRKPPGSLTAYDLVLQAVDALFRITYQPFLRARQLLLEAIEIDPGYAPAYSYAAYASIFQVGEGWSEDPWADAQAAADFATKAIERDPHDATALAIYGHVQSFLLHDFDAAVQALDRALEVGPNCPLAWTMSAATCGYLGQGDLAVERATRGLRLSPLDVRVFWPQAILGQSHYVAGNYDQAVEWSRKALGNCPSAVFNLRALAASLVARGEVQEAREIARRLLQLLPDFRLGAYAARCPFRGERLSAWIDRLRRAGLPD